MSTILTTNHIIQDWMEFYECLDTFQIQRRIKEINNADSNIISYKVEQLRALELLMEQRRN